MEFAIVFMVVLYCGAWVFGKVSDWLDGSPADSPPRTQYHSNSSDDISRYDINAIRSSGNFSAAERKAEYRRRGKSPSGVIDGVYNDMYRGNDSYNDAYRDHDADA